uniref:Variant surface glycoprotein 563 n=1 Tax=Trypanosoma brucei TaxID=5691 RepID=M4T0B5_9TRYP|nr:variant surface glycoprotein 563 [Trypanosoma brucei]
MKNTVKLLLAMLFISDAQAANDKVAEAVQDICKERAYLLDLAKFLQDAGSSYFTDQNALLKQAAKWQLAAAAETSQEGRCKFLTLSRFATLEAYKQERQYTEALAKHREANNLVQQQIGLLTAAAAAAKLKLKEDSNQHAATNAGVLTLKFKLDNSGDTVCTGKEKVTEIERTGKEPNHRQATSILLTAAEDITKLFATATVAISGLNSCGNNGPSALATAANNCAFDGGETMAITFATATKKLASASTKIFNSDDDKSKCDSATDTITEQTPATKILARKICEAMLKPYPQLAKTAQLSGKQLKENPDFRVWTRNCNPRFRAIKDLNSGENLKYLQTYIETTYGDTTNKFKQTFLDEVDKTKLPSRSSAEQASKDIEELADTKTFSETITHLEDLRSQKEAAPSAQHSGSPTETPANAENCKEKSQGECKDENGCEFKDGKCQAKVTTTTGTDAKTNTTGSNSFVFSKVLLMLPFFISIINFQKNIL